MNILLTGGAGYIGSHLATVLHAAGHRVVLLDNLCNSSAGVVDALQAITGERLPFIEADVRDRAAVTRALTDHRIDAVVHLAGLKAVGDSVADPLTYHDNNVGGSISVLQAMQDAGVWRFVFSSSATVYGVPQYLPYDEAHPVGAINPYGQTKLHVENVLTELAASDARWRLTSLRYFNPVGAHPSGAIGDDPRGVPNNLMPYIARVAAGRLPRLQVFGKDYDTVDGTGVRDYLHVMDLADGHLAALLHQSDQTVGHAVFNLGTGHGTSVLQLVQAFERATGVNIPYAVAPRRAGDLPAYWARADQAHQVLGWRATRTLDEMCASTWRHAQTAMGD